MQHYNNTQKSYNHNTTYNIFSEDEVNLLKEIGHKYKKEKPYEKIYKTVKWTLLFFGIYKILSAEPAIDHEIKVSPKKYNSKIEYNIDNNIIKNLNKGTIKNKTMESLEKIIIKNNN